jgi:hypothetical protein
MVGIGPCLSELVTSSRLCKPPVPNSTATLQVGNFTLGKPRVNVSGFPTGIRIPDTYAKKKTEFMNNPMISSLAGGNATWLLY